MFKILILAVPTFAIALWWWSLYSLRQWHYFLPFYLANAFVSGSYIFATMNGGIGFSGHDEYGLGRIAAALLALLVHVIAVAFFTLWFRCHHRTNALKPSV